MVASFLFSLTPTLPDIGVVRAELPRRRFSFACRAEPMDGGFREMTRRVNRLLPTDDVNMSLDFVQATLYPCSWSTARSAAERRWLSPSESGYPNRRSGGI